jgi:hypothetical protein
MKQHLTAQTNKLEHSLGTWINSLDVTDSKIMRKSKRLFMNGCECKEIILLLWNFWTYTKWGKNESMSIGNM